MMPRGKSHKKGKEKKGHECVVTASITWRLLLDGSSTIQLTEGCIGNLKYTSQKRTDPIPSQSLSPPPPFSSVSYLFPSLDFAAMKHPCRRAISRERIIVSSTSSSCPCNFSFSIKFSCFFSIYPDHVIWHEFQLNRRNPQFMI